VKFITIYYILIYTLMVNSHNVSYVIMLFIYKMVYNFFSALLLTHLSLVLYRYRSTDS